jgi:hypothetical protein
LLLGAVVLALITPVIQHDEELLEPWRTLGDIILAMAAVPPEQSHETRYLVREVRSGRGLVATTRLSSATPAIEPLREEVLS